MALAIFLKRGCRREIFPLPKDMRLGDKEQEKLLLIAMVEDLTTL